MSLKLISFTLAQIFLVNCFYVVPLSKGLSSLYHGPWTKKNIIILILNKSECFFMTHISMKYIIYISERNKIKFNIESHQEYQLLGWVTEID